MRAPIPGQLAPGALPPGWRIYAIGDVHGCADRLAALHALIAEDAARWPAARTSLVHLGDYVDRGPDSAGVLAALLGPPPLEGAECVNLLGNHEVMLLDACDPQAHPGALPFWLENGGAETLASYGADPADPAAVAAVLPEHLDMLRHCPLSYEAGDYLFVHAGVRPGIPTDRQDPFDLLWIREPFLSFEGDLPQVVVHGHTPTEIPGVRPHRIGIDTGACFGGALTCLVLEGQRLRFLTS
ncbi:metallophosphoesterase family protein [Paeniroseomonas aquatica]|uniref:Metallophosphoesterase family protein n=1 Tax=Paeniroseomonas aquatica TaxID=373043 RepID=A0ABT8AFF7_9PROT|nr:metallophosphoesterase family protein [Paeniroseomonas aquatica]MDN3568562.1 metallophosphoesterase family protein [Paeniroseomonas aquatica]